MVGAVIVAENRIIGEGFHRAFGEPHAEVNAISSIAPSDRHLLPHSTMYVSLEPCCHHGKTPPCTNRIIAAGIPHVVISVKDPNPEVSGKGIAQLRARDIAVHTGTLREQGLHLIRGFAQNMRKRRPFVLLKFAQSRDNFLGKPDRQVWLSNPYSTVLSHKLRAQYDAIMVGTNTAVVDNPSLTNRHYFGPSPIRVLLDRTCRVPEQHKIFSAEIETIVYCSEATPASVGSATRVAIDFNRPVLQQVLADLANRGIQKLMVEGGGQLLNSFIESNLWDEAWIVKAPVTLESGVRAPLVEGHFRESLKIGSDTLLIVQNPANLSVPQTD